MPELTRSHSNNLLSLSGAHGFMAFNKKALEAALPVARKALERSKELPSEHKEVLWGLDTLVLLVIEIKGFKVKVRTTPAIEMRNRPSAKCANQLRDTQILFQLYKEIKH